MKEVFDTVSEVNFKSIAAVGLIALLSMGAIWWVLAGSASTSRPVESTPSQGLASSRVQERTKITPPVASDQQPLEVIVKSGNALEENLQSSPASTASLELEDLESHYTVQIGAFQQKDGARKRMAELAERGYDSHLVSLEEAGTVTFRLVVGAFPSYDEASAAADGLKVAGIDAFVRNIE